jgi:hypothetical protein
MTDVPARLRKASLPWPACALYPNWVVPATIVTSVRRFRLCARCFQSSCHRLGLGDSFAGEPCNRSAQHGPPRSDHRPARHRFALAPSRSVSAKQVGYQTSSTDGPCDLSGAPPRCEMVSLAGLSSHRRPCARCGHIALPIVQIGASPEVVACPVASAAVHPSKRQGLGQSTTFTVSLAGITETQAIARRAKRTTIPLPRVNCLQGLSRPGDPAAIRLPRTKLGTTAIISRFAGDRHPNLSFR